MTWQNNSCLLYPHSPFLCLFTFVFFVRAWFFFFLFFVFYEGMYSLLDHLQLFHVALGCHFSLFLLSLEDQRFENS